MSPIGKLADYANCADYCADYCDDYCDDHCDDYCDDYCDDPSGFPVWVWPLSLTVCPHSVTVWLTVSQCHSLAHSVPHSRCGQLLPGFDDRAAVKLTVVSTFACELLQFALCDGDMGGPMRPMRDR